MTATQQVKMGMKDFLAAVAQQPTLPTFVTRRHPSDALLLLAQPVVKRPA